MAAFKARTRSRIIDTAIITAGTSRREDADRLARQVAGWLAARGGRAGVAALTDLPAASGRLAAADAVVVVNADHQGLAQTAILGALQALPGDALAGKPVLPVIRAPGREHRAAAGFLHTWLQDRGAALVLNPVALAEWDFTAQEGEAIRLAEGLLALIQAVPFCRRLDAEKRRLAEGLDLGGRFAFAPLLA